MGGGSIQWDNSRQAIRTYTTTHYAEPFRSIAKTMLLWPVSLKLPLYPLTYLILERLAGRTAISVYGILGVRRAVFPTRMKAEASAGADMAPEDRSSGR